MRRNNWRETPNPGKTAIFYCSSQLFLVTMGTGILAVNLQTLPYQFNGLGILSIVVWMIDLILFLAILGAFTAKWVMFPASSYRQFSTNPELTYYFSTVSISCSTLLEMTALVLGSTWSGWDTACLVFFWCDVVLAIFCAILPFWVSVHKEHVQVANLPPTALYPAVSMLSTSAAGSVVCYYTTLSTRAAMPIWHASMLLLGMGFIFALAFLANFTTRLLINSTPEAKKAMAAFIPIASLSNAAYSAAQLGRLASPSSKNLIAGYGRGSIATVDIGNVFYGVGVAACLCLVGISVFWLLFACLVVAFDARKAPWNFTWHSALYPIGVLALAFGILGQVFDSPTYRTLNTIGTCCLLLLWLFNIGQTILRLVTGELLLGEARESGDSRESTEKIREVRNVRNQIQDEEAGNGEGEEEQQSQDQD